MDIKINGKWVQIPTAHANFMDRRSLTERVVPVNITLSKDDLARLDAIKDKTGSSRSALIRVAINILEQATK